MTADPSALTRTPERRRRRAIRRIRALSVSVLLVALVLVGCSGAASTPAPIETPAGSVTVSASPTASDGAGDVLTGDCERLPSGSPTCRPSSGVPVTPAPTVLPTAVPLRYPLTLRDDEGTAAILQEAPRRIASLTPASTETLYALGADDLLVARSEGDDYPPEATKLPAVATYAGVEIEQLVALEPDLVIAGGNGFTPAADIEKLRSLGMTVVVVYAESLEAVLRDIELVGQAAGRDEEGRALAASLRSRINTIAEAAQAVVPRPRVFYELDATKEIYGPARDSFLAGMIVLAGGNPITTDDPRSYAISLERLVGADPQVIVLGDAAYGVSAEIVAARPGWGNMAAVRLGAIRPVNDVIVSRPGPRIADGLAALALAINPTLVLPPEGTADGAGATASPSGSPAQ